jgi:hypothetical protein
MACVYARTAPAADADRNPPIGPVGAPFYLFEPRPATWRASVATGYSGASTAGRSGGHRTLATVTDLANGRRFGVRGLDAELTPIRRRRR